LRRGKEALGDGVVERAAFGAHRDGDAGVAGLLAEGQRDELTGLNWSSQRRVLGVQTVAAAQARAEE
jgi:hypothetical protein